MKTAKALARLDVASSLARLASERVCKSLVLLESL